MHEIVTLQFGQQANYVGTHFWNTQESYFTYDSETKSPIDHDVHFRPGLSPSGSETYTPRAILYDLKGAFGTLRRENALYTSSSESNPSTSSPWSGATSTIHEPAIAPSAYQQSLDAGVPAPQLSTSSVRFWSDFNRVFYHPRSLVQINEFELGSQIAPFERWDTGEELFESLDRENDLLDRDMRRFLEECDQLQAVQVLTGTDDAWGGFAARYLERLRDEGGKIPVWVWGFEEGGRRARARQMLQAANVAKSLYSMVQQASMYTPLTTVPTSLPSYISGFDQTSRWHTSALQATAIETIGIPSRLRSDQEQRATLDAIETTISNDGKRRVAQLDLSVEDPAVLSGTTNGHGDHDSRMNGYNGHNAGEDEDDNISRLDISFAPSIPYDPSSARQDRGAKQATIFGQMQSLRGRWKSGLEIEEINFAARDRFAQGPRIQTHQTDLLFPALDSFPDIYHFGSAKPKSLAVQASLSTSAEISRQIRALEQVASRVVGLDEREALSDGLRTLCEEYEDGWSSGSEDGFDDT